MAEELTFISGSKEEQYLSLLPQVRSLIEGEVDLVANLANVAAALKEAFDFFWVGFYLVKQDQLVLGPFQGPVACTRIRKGKGVCGTAWQEGATLLVPDVEVFPGHIACSAFQLEKIAGLWRTGGEGRAGRLRELGLTRFAGCLATME